MLIQQFLTNKILVDPRQRRFFKSNNLHELFVLGKESEVNETGQLFENSNLNNNKKGRTLEGECQDNLELIAGVDSTEQFKTNEVDVKVSENENDRILSSLFSNSSVHSALDNDKIMSSMGYIPFYDRPDQIIVEREANKVAEDAIRALKEDRKRIKRNDYSATWTGKSGTVSKFASGSFKSVSSTSSSILSNLKGFTFRKASTASEIIVPLSSLAPELSSSPRPASHQDLAERIREFLHQSGGSLPTAEIVKKFNVTTSSEEYPIFRNLLRSIASFNAGTWALKEEFR